MHNFLQKSRSSANMVWSGLQHTYIHTHNNKDQDILNYQTHVTTIYMDDVMYNSNIYIFCIHDANAYYFTIL